MTQDPERCFDPRRQSAEQFEAERAVDQAVDGAAQILLGSDVPMAKAEELLAVLQGPAVRDVLRIRAEQIVEHGHSLADDLVYPRCWLVNDAKGRLAAALDNINAPPPKRDLPLARRRIARAAAVLLAALDVLDAVIAEERGN